MLEQRIFEWVAAHLIHQNSKAYDHGVDSCAYFASDGSKCAVGSLISAENYNVEMDGGLGMPPHQPLVRNAMARSLGIPAEDLPYLLFFKDLQTIHDEYDENQWPAELVEFARDNNLAAPGWLMEKVTA